MKKSFIFVAILMVSLSLGAPCFPGSEEGFSPDAENLRFATPGGAPVLYPFTVILGSWPGEQRANRETADLRGRGIPAAVAYGPVAGMGIGYSETDVYTVHVGSFRSRQSSDTETMRLRRLGHVAFSSAYDLPGRGVWHRVFAGLYRTRAEAAEAAGEFPNALPFLVEGAFFEICARFLSTEEEAVYAARELKKRGFTLAEVQKRPYAIQIGASDSETELAETEYRARQNGYLAYRVPDRRNRYVSRILIGAFEMERDAAGMRDKLEKLGFRPVIVLR